MSVWPRARLWMFFLPIFSRREDICGSLEWFAKRSLQLGIQTRLVSMALPTPRPGLRGSRAMGEVHMLHFPEVQLDVSMEASEGHKGAHNENKTARCPPCSSAGAKRETSYVPSKHILTEQYPQLCALPIQLGVSQVSKQLLCSLCPFLFLYPLKGQKQ